MSSPAVSVVIPSYNHARFIGEAVDSVLGSSFKDLELVIVDDGSDDDTLDVLLPYRAEPRVTIQAQENRGAHAAINVGLALAGGSILFILNSDDAYHPDRIGRLVGAFNADPKTVIAASWIEVVDGEGASMGIKQGFRNMPPWPPPSQGPFLSGLGDEELALLETNFVATNLQRRVSAVADRGPRAGFPAPAVHPRLGLHPVGVPTRRFSADRGTAGEVPGSRRQHHPRGRGSGQRRDALRGDVDRDSARAPHVRAPRRRGRRPC